GMDARERVVLEHETDLVAVLLEHVVLEGGVDAAAEGALEVGVLDDRHLRVLRAPHRLVVELDLLADLVEGVDGEIDGVAAEEKLPVAADVERDVLALLAER